MNPLHFVLAGLAVVVFVVAAWLAPQPEPVWRRIVSVGLAFLAASFIW